MARRQHALVRQILRGSDSETDEEVLLKRAQEEVYLLVDHERRTIDSALKRIVEAIELHLRAMREDGPRSHGRGIVR